MIQDCFRLKYAYRWAALKIGLAGRGAVKGALSGGISLPADRCGQVSLACLRL